MKFLFQNHKPSQSLGTQRFCVFSHFDLGDRVERYVLHYLQELKQLGYETIFVSTSKDLGTKDIAQLRPLCHTACLRENVGYDFGSYKEGIHLIQSAGQKPSSLLLANDSVFGPFWNLGKIWDPNILEHYDLYGLTDSFDHGYHLQSYFLAFSRRLLESSAFMAFWNGVQNIDPCHQDFKSAIIQNYEVGGTKHFLFEGFSIGAAFPFERILTQRIDQFTESIQPLKTAAGYSKKPDVRELMLNFNATHRYWDTLLDMGFPFIKRELLTRNPTFTDIKAWPEKLTTLCNYDASMIAEALVSMNAIQSLYVLDTNETIKRLSAPSDVIECQLNEAFHPYSTALGLSLTARFIFDDDYYLERNPDVKIAVQNGRLPHGLHHFKNNGQFEGRVHRYKLVG